MATSTSLKKRITPVDVARYFLYRCTHDGDLITPLKMQKLVYYAYVWTLVNTKKHLFAEQPQAWPNGPVVPSLYKVLKKYGSSPIDGEFMKLQDEKELQVLTDSFGDLVQILDKVYVEYGTKSAFELVTLTHNEKPWKNARMGLGPFDKSSVCVSDNDILEEYGSKE